MATVFWENTPADKTTAGSTDPKATFGSLGDYYYGLGVSWPNDADGTYQDVSVNPTFREPTRPKSV